MEEVKRSELGIEANQDSRNEERQSKHDRVESVKETKKSQHLKSEAHEMAS